MRFKVGQEVKALSAEQGLTAGAEYKVVEARATWLIFSHHTSYKLSPLGTQSLAPVEVVNGHYLLEEIGPRASCNN